MIKEKKQAELPVRDTNLFGRENYMWMLAGAIVMIIGFLLMAGGKSSDPKVFNANEVYSHTRITVAPILIIAGFLLEIVGILKKAKSTVVA